MPGWIAAGGAIVGGLLSKSGQSSANKTNIALSDKQINFQKKMSKTAHQREVKDLIKAGLNPILSAGGGGASTPPGSLPEVSNENEALASSAKQLAREIAEIKNIKEQSKAYGAQTVKTLADANLINNTMGALTTTANEAAKKAHYDAEISRINKEITEKSVPRAEAEERVNQLLYDNALKLLDRFTPNWLKDGTDYEKSPKVDLKNK